MCLTVDAAVAGNRERDRRTGFTTPPRLTFASLLSFALHPSWTFNHFFSEKFILANIVHMTKKGTSIDKSVIDYIDEQFDPAMSWKEAEYCVKKWNGPFALKGVMSVEDAKKAIDMIDEDINAMHGTIEDLPNFMNYDWVIANGVFNLGLTEEHSFWIIENMISHANKGIIFNMLLAPYEDPKYEAYNPMWIHYKLQEYDHKKIEIIENYMGDDAEFTVYFYV